MSANSNLKEHATMARRTDEISNSDDIIDSRDVIARIEHLESELLDAGTAFDLEKDELTGTTHDRGDLQELQDELDKLKALQEEAEPYAPDWQYGATLIRDSYFVEYCEDLVKDIGDVPRELPHYIAIDWDATAENIKVDYTSVDFDGVTYWIR
jgi:hypothetical protein